MKKLVYIGLITYLIVGFVNSVIYSHEHPEQYAKEVKQGLVFWFEE